MPLTVRRGAWTLTHPTIKAAATRCRRESRTMVPRYDKRAIQDAAAAAGMNIPRTVEATRLPVDKVIAIFNGSRYVELSELLAVVGLLKVSMTALFPNSGQDAHGKVDFEILLKNRKRPFWRVVDESESGVRSAESGVAPGRVAELSAAAAAAR